MPGIAGIIGKKGVAGLASTVESMVKPMLHEPWYRSGTYINESLGLGVGWVTHQGSYSDCLPIWNEAKNICLVFSGEEFRDSSAIQSLRSKGHRFQDGNASYLVHLYEELGDGFLQELNGIFSGLLVDLRSRHVHLFNDRYGMDRIYWHENGRGLYFSSEAKALLRVLPTLRNLDVKSLGEFYSCGCVLQNRTLFSGLYLLPGGSVWTHSPGSELKRKTYFEPHIWEQRKTSDASVYYENLKDTWKRVLPKYLDTESGIALSLTGGLDSRLILAWSRRPGNTFPCYTFNGMYRECMDVKVARHVAKLCGSPHYTLEMDPAFFDEFPNLVQKSVYLTDGTLDATGAVDLYLQRKARQIAPIRVTGLCGGEFLRALIVFEPALVHQSILEPEVAQAAEKAANTYRKELQGPRLSFIAFKQSPWFIYARLALERSQLTLRAPYFDNELVALAYEAPVGVESSKLLTLRLITEGNSGLQRVSSDTGLASGTTPGLGACNRLYQQLTMKAEYAFDYAMPQWLSKCNSVLRSLAMERLFLGRHKIGHFRVWYRDELSLYVKDILLDPRTQSRSYLQGKELEKLVIQHTTGHHNFTREIHKLLSLELINRTLIEMN